MELKEELKQIREKRFIPYSKMAEIVKVKPTTFYQWLYGNTTLAKNKVKALEVFANAQRKIYYDELL